MPTAVHSLRRLPGGDAGIRATLREMKSIVKTWKHSPQLRELALRITANCGVRGDWFCEAQSLTHWVRDNIRFVGDIAEVETLQTPDVTLRYAAGDCDDQSILLATLLQTIEHPARFLAVDVGQGGLTHVFVETPIGAHWWAAETTEPDFVFGRRPWGIRRNMVQAI